MFPGINPRQLKQAMKQMGVSQEDLNVTEVIIKTQDKILVFNSPEVQKVTMQGQTNFHVTGSYEERVEEAKIDILEDDVKMVQEQAGVSENEARRALDSSKGDIAQAIIDLNEN